MAKKLKDVVKMNPDPARGKVGVDPTDPWSAKANIAEAASLDQYLLSRGINPKFVSGDTKISHAKSSAFLKWKQNHQFESVEPLDEDALLDKFLMSRGINPRYATKDMKISHSKSGQFIKWKKDHMFESVEYMDETLTTKHTPTELRKHILGRAEHMHKEIKSNGIHKKLHSEEVDKEDTLTFDIPLMIRMLELAREDVKDDMELHRITERLIEIRNKGTLTMDDYDFIAGIKKLKEEIEELAEGRMKDIATDTAETQRLNKMTTLQKFRAGSAAREKKHADIEKSSGGMTSAIDRLEKHLNKEEVEQIDELKQSTLSSYKDKSTASLKNAQANRDAAEPGKDMSKGFADLHAKSDAIAKKRVKGLIGYMQRKQGMKPTSENTLDPLAATEAPCDCANTSDDTTPKQKAMSKSARIIKSLYKRKGVVKEDMYDHEKEDKSVQSYGKKPKVMEPDEKKNLGEKKPDARVVMSGGTTLTGEKRDTVEIDPLMKNRPGPDTFGATGKKASQQ